MDWYTGRVVLAEWWGWNGGNSGLKREPQPRKEGVLFRERQHWRGRHGEWYCLSRAGKRAASLQAVTRRQGSGREGELSRRALQSSGV